jgi:hypothetical protein
MKSTTLITIGIVVIALIGIVLKLKNQKRVSQSKRNFEPRQPVTEREQTMFWRLTEAFPQPQTTIHCEMSFGALLNAPEGMYRGSFDRKKADFVLTNKGFKVIAIIELDDSTHRGREKEDQQREQMLTGAGYRVLRYKTIPSVEELHRDLPDIAQSDEKLLAALAIVAKYKAKTP